MLPLLATEGNVRRIVALASVLGGLLSMVTAVLPAASVQAQVSIRTRAGEVTGPLSGLQLRTLPFAASHVAVYWAGNHDADVTVAFGAGEAQPVVHDEVGEQRANGITYGTVMPAGGATAVTLSTDRPLGRVTVIAFADGPATVTATLGARPAGAAVAQPAIISRAGWGADESLRFDASGKETWVPEFWPVQKLIVHHTAGRNADPDPKATIRSMYYYHAITQGWGDIGYNFLVDEAGNVYKGRHSHLPGSSDDTITGEDGGSPGRSVTAAHAYQHNAGTIGVALLGTLTTQDATAAAKNAVVEFLAWKAEAHGLDPYGTSVYTNPVSGLQKTLANIAAHRDTVATECPGTAFYNTLPQVRAAVAGRIAGTGPDTAPPSAPANLKAASAGAKRSISLSWTASTDTGGSGLAGYEVFRATSASGPFTKVATTTSTSFTNGSLTRSRTYWYYVRAFDRAGNFSAISNTVSAVAT
jgi:hypothetical protein